VVADVTHRRGIVRISSSGRYPADA